MFGIDIAATAARIGIDNFFKAVQSFLYGLVVPKTSGFGIKVDTDNPTFGFADLIGEITPRPAGGTVPSFVVYRGGIYQYRFDTAGTNEVFNNYHIPHDIVPGSDMFVHTHWSVASAPTGDINWMFDVMYAKGYAQSVFEGTDGTNAQCVLSLTDTPTTAFQHRIAEILLATSGGLYDPAPGINVSITSGAAILTASAPLFSAADVSRTVCVLGAGAAGGDLNVAVTTFTSTTQVTLSANASTTVTAQPNFRYRILDSDLIEPDGLIFLRTWNQPNRAADTLNVNPWLHFVDIHYQTNGVMGTKDKNYPFYT